MIGWIRSASATGSGPTDKSYCCPALRHAAWPLGSMLRGTDDHVWPRPPSLGPVIAMPEVEVSTTIMSGGWSEHEDSHGDESSARGVCRERQRSFSFLLPPQAVLATMVMTMVRCKGALP